MVFVAEGSGLEACERACTVGNKARDRHPYLRAPAASFLAAPVTIPRTSSSFIMRKSSPSILISVPEYFPNRMRSPSFTARGNSLPSSLVLPLPTEMTSPSCGLSLAESGMMMPPRLVPASSTRRTRMRSCSGVNFVAILADSFHSYPVEETRAARKPTSRFLLDAQERLCSRQLYSSPPSEGGG